MNPAIYAADRRSAALRYTDGSAQRAAVSTKRVTLPTSQSVHLVRALKYNQRARQDAARITRRSQPEPSNQMSQILS
jgi:hypothetical protein